MAHSKDAMAILLEEMRQIKENQQKTHVALFGDDLSTPPYPGAIQKIISRQDRTNGKVKLSLWVATTALTLVTSIIMIFVSGGLK